MSIIPCEKNRELRQKIEDFAEVLKTESHALGDHGLSEHDFYASGLFRGAIERVRGQFSATMREKRDFVRHVLNYLQDCGHIVEWESAGEANRHDYSVVVRDGYVAAIELKGCMDGNNTNIFERPPHAHEFVIWSVCTNRGADPRHNAWSGIHTRLSAEVISRDQRVDGVVIWDWVCGTLGRPCPKVAGDPARLTELAQYRLTPPCIYVLPATVPSPRTNPRPTAQNLEDVKVLKALHDCFGGREDEVNYVEFEVGHAGPETVRTTLVKRGGSLQRKSDPTPIQRS